MIVLHVPCLAQDEEKKKPVKIELIFANSLEYDSKRVNAKRLIGNVQFKHENALLFCDSAYLYEESNSIDAYSNVRITQGDSLQMFGDTLFYDGNTREAEIKNNVRLINKETTLTTNYLIYNRDKKVAYYSDGGEMINTKENNRLVSKKGYYYTDSKSFFFKDSVVLTNPDYKMTSDTLEYHSSSEVVRFHGPTTIETKDSTLITCEKGYYSTQDDYSELYDNAQIFSKDQALTGDSIFYNRSTGYGLVKCYGAITDTSERIVVHGDYIELFEKQDSAMATEFAYIEQQDEEDTLFMHADTFRIYPDTAGHRQLFGFHHVRFFKHDMQGKCDSFYYSLHDSILELHYDPVLWSDESQITGDMMVIRMSKGQIHSLTIDNNSFIASRVDSARYNQIKGRALVGLFAKNKLYRVQITGNGESLYYAQDDKKKYIGLNQATSSNILIRMKDNKINKISFQIDPEAKLHPLTAPEAKRDRLDGFVWLGPLRPAAMLDIFDQPTMQVVQVAEPEE